MKKFLMSIIAIMSLFMVGCTEEIDTSSRYVFKEETITSYLSKHEQYSEYYRILNEVKVSKISETNVLQLLSARGHYTVFAPTNDAIQKYLDSLVTTKLIPEANWDAFAKPEQRDSIYQVIVFNSIIDSGNNATEYETNSFPTPSATSQTVEIPIANMNDRKLVVRYTDVPDSLLINDCTIDYDNRNILCINGLIHAMHNVISPSNNTMSQLLKKYIEDKNSNFVIAATIIKECGLLDTLAASRDETYEYLYQTEQLPESKTSVGDSGNETFYTPEHRYYGFTFFAETDEFWTRALGKSLDDITLDDVMTYLDGQGMYPEAKRDKNYKSEDNLLYQFITYHLLPERLPAEKLVYHYNEKGYDINRRTPTVAVMEFYTTMGKRRLLKLFESRQSDGVCINRFPNLDDDRRGTYHELSCDPDKEGIHIGEPRLDGENNIRNGIIYPIDKLLYYSEETRNNLQKQRIRWSVPSMWPEFMNNDIRCCEITNDNKRQYVYIPTDQEYKYLNDVEISNETLFFYWPGRGRGWQNMQGDEMTIRGILECTMRLPPVPQRGTYELRFAIQSGGNRRGMVQFYWGSNKNKLAAMGIPIDLRQGADNKLHTSSGDVASDIGFEEDTNDDEYNMEIDKRLRNNGFMKGCNQYCAGAPGSTKMMRASNVCIRRIIIREQMDPDQTYYIKFKTVMDDPTRFFYMDYLEYCAKDVYDNPEKPEDIW